MDKNDDIYVDMDGDTYMDPDPGEDGNEDVDEGDDADVDKNGSTNVGEDGGGATMIIAHAWFGFKYRPSIWFKKKKRFDYRSWSKGLSSSKSGISSVSSDKGRFSDFVAQLGSKKTHSNESKRRSWSISPPNCWYFYCSGSSIIVQGLRNERATYPKRSVADRKEQTMSEQEIDKVEAIVTECEQPQVKEHPYKIGEKYLIRTVTQYHTGRLKAVYPQELVIEEAAWITDTGRFFNFLDKGIATEIEPFIDDIIVSRGAIVDVTVFRHELPRKQKG